MFNNILIICVGNICRSPTAEALFRHRLQRKNLTISSAGIGALVGHPMDKNAQEILQANGLEFLDHHARQVDCDMLHRAELILTMENRHIRHLRQIAPEIQGKTFLIGRWQEGLEIPDPYRQTRPEFEQAYNFLSKSVDSWLPYLK